MSAHEDEQGAGRGTEKDAGLTEHVGRTFAWAMKQREEHGRHLHHSACIHNLPPEEQVEIRGKTVEWWLRFGPLPVQITPDQWECEPPPPRPTPPTPPAADPEPGLCPHCGDVIGTTTRPCPVHNPSTREDPEPGL